MFRTGDVVIKAVVFDLDDTLYDELSYVLQGLNQVSLYLAQKYSIDRQEIFQRMKHELECHGRGKIFDHVCQQLSIKESIEELVYIYRNTVPVLELYPDSAQLLKKLKKAGIKTGIITDGSSMVQHRKIEALGLRTMVDYIIVTDDYGTGYAKPSKEPYLDILKKLGCAPGETVYVGDNPYKDFIGAKAVGLATVRVRREKGMFCNTDLSTEYEADKTIRNLLELEGLLT
ncbi:MAG: Phosphoglycolate phosphatase [Lachnoclostridium sp.]|jgi:putative hydrolase of the HAD superfamily